MRFWPRQASCGEGLAVRPQPRDIWAGRGMSSVVVLAVIAGCAIVPRSRMDECQQLTQSLRADNARLKDRVLALQGQNRDYAERAVDDARRLAVQDEAIERLEHSVQAYQDERTRLEAAYKQLVSNLGVAGPDAEPARGDAPGETGSRAAFPAARPPRR